MLRESNKNWTHSLGSFSSPQSSLQFALLLWNALLFSFLLDPLLYLIIKPLLQGVSPKENETILLLVFAALFSFKELALSCSQLIGRTKDTIRKDKGHLVLILVVLTSGAVAIELLLRIKNLLFLNILVPIAAAFVVTKSVYGLLKETKQRLSLLKSSAEYNLVSVNQQNLLFCLAPAVLSRAAAIFSFISLNHGNSGFLDFLTYIIAIYIFIDSKPQATQFFELCQSCGAKVARLHRRSVRCSACTNGWTAMK